MKLTTKQFWNARHETLAQSTAINVRARKGWIRHIVDNARLRQGARVGQSYSSYVFDKLLKVHLPIRPDWSAIEIGCAPGTNLVNLHSNFGYKPYGVEYSHAGVILTQETFCKHGFDTANVIEADFFDRDFQEKFRCKFDVVLSMGFIEHFDPPGDVVSLHVNLLKPGGLLVCTIPNLRGVCYPFVRLCAFDHLKLHNCTIMRKRAFQHIFEPFALNVKFCGYVGGFDLHASPFSHERNLRGFVAVAMDRLQDILDHCMFLFYKGHFPESRLSANLAFVGQRTL